MTTRRITVMGKHWRLRFVRRLPENIRGMCDSPELPRKQIRVLQSLRGQEQLEVVLHELLHAANWHLDEEWVDQFAKDASHILTALGHCSEGE